ncbi:MAG: hypothetical protein PHD48_00840 [Alphaproteobacteria bacterium]|nr:hypothetical protein [Alphaproteobacteria bacterium]
MVAQNILVATANFYSIRAKDDPRYEYPRDVLTGAIQQLRFSAHLNSGVIKNSSEFIVLRTSGTTGEPKLLRHPMDFHAAVVESGVQALSRNGMLENPHVCMIAISRGRLSGGFLFIYEVVRQSGWSILLTGASDDSEDVSNLCNKFSVDTIFMAPNVISAVFTKDMIGQFNTVKNILYIGEVPSTSIMKRFMADFPHIRLKPFCYSSNDTGPLGIPKFDSDDYTYDVPDNVLLEVETADGNIALNGTGNILVSVMGLEDPKLIRFKVGDVGILATKEDGSQTIDVQGRGDISVKFHLDTVGGSVILQKSVVLDFLQECALPKGWDIIINIVNRNDRTILEMNIISDIIFDENVLTHKLNDEFPVLQLRGRMLVKKIDDEQAAELSPGKRRFFIKSY